MCRGTYKNTYKAQVTSSDFIYKFTTFFGLWQKNSGKDSPQWWKMFKTENYT